MKKEPKTFEYKGKVWTQFSEQCKSCSLCIEKCPVKCLSPDESVMGHFGQPSVKCEIEKCIQCGTCEKTCPEMAIRVKN